VRVIFWYQQHQNCKVTADKANIVQQNGGQNENTAKKVMCIVMVLILVLSVNSSVAAGAFRGGVIDSTVVDYYDRADDTYYTFEFTTDMMEWDCPDEEEYYMTHGRWRDLTNYLNFWEYLAFRASGLRLSEFQALRAEGLWFCEIHNMWLDPAEHGITLLWELPYSDEPWPEDSELEEEWAEMIFGYDQRIWFCPDEEEYYMTHGRYLDLANYLLNFWEYRAYRISGTRLTEFLALRESGLWFCDILEMWVYPEEHGIVFFNELPYSYEEWLDDDAIMAAQMWQEPVKYWLCPDDEEYYMTHGRFRDISLYLSLTEYNVWTVSGMRLVEFLALREAGMTLREIAAIIVPHIEYKYALGYILGYPGEVFYFYDLPIVYEEWLEDDAILFYYDAIMPMSTPTLTVSRGTTTSTSVVLSGILSNVGTATVTARGFWIRRDNQTSHREVLVNTTSNSFTSTIPSLIPNSTYHARAIARVSGTQGARQSNAISFNTLPNVTVPGQPRIQGAVPGVGQVTLNWLAPLNNGGATITRYEVALNNGGWVTAQSTTRHVFSGLAAGTHTFRVRAVNSAGAGTQASTTASPIPVVNTPTVTVSRGTITSTTVTVTGNITNTGGAPITARGFWIRRDDQTTQREILVNTSSNTFSNTISNLTPNATYHVRAIARNSGTSGTGQSNAISFRTPADVPGPPRIQSAVPGVGVGLVTLNWLAPLNNGGAAITRYEVALNNGVWVTAQGTTWHTFTGLTPGTHTFRVRAVNSAGAGIQANITASPNSVSVPTLTLTRGAIISNTVTVTGNITNTGGAPITVRGFWIRRADQANHREILVNTTSNTFRELITGLSHGSTYHVRAFARNSGVAGFGQSSEAIFTTPANNFTITFNANGGTVSPSSVTHIQGTNIDNMPTPTRPGYTFVAWYTARTGGTRVTATTPVNNNVTFFARWNATGFTITLNPNGGTVSPSTVNRLSGAMMDGLPTPTRAGHAFAGWFTARTGGIQIHAGTTVSGNMTVYARWYAISIIFDSNGGGPVPSQPITPGAPIGQLPPAPRRQDDTLGQRFVGWYTTRTFGGTRVTINTVAPGHSMTVFARWECNVSLNPTRIRSIWWNTNRVPIRWFEIDSDLGSYWSTAMTNGVRNWNVSDAPVEFYMTSSGNRVVTVPSTGTYLGLFRPRHTIFGRFTSFEITLCPINIPAYATRQRYNVINVITSVMAHELAHAIGLRDGEQPQNNHPTVLGGFSNASLMNGGRNRNIITGPQAFDIESVRLIYD